MPDQDDSPGTVWVRTTPDENGVYRVTLEATDDDSTFLDREGALLWAEHVLICVTYALYDSKVFRQLSAKAERDAAIQVIQDLRKDRVMPVSTTSLSFQPSVNIQGDPFLVVLHKGKPVGQWTLDDARSHATAVIEAIHAADLDADYRRVLVGVVGLDDELARRAVDGLSTYGG